MSAMTLAVTRFPAKTNRPASSMELGGYELLAARPETKHLLSMTQYVGAAAADLKSIGTIKTTLECICILSLLTPKGAAVNP